MSWNWIAFGVGLFIGMSFGVCIMGLLAMSRQAEDREEKMYVELERN